MLEEIPAAGIGIVGYEEREECEYLEYWPSPVVFLLLNGPVRRRGWDYQLGKGFFLQDWGQKTSKPAGNNPVLLPGFINSGGLGKGGQGGGIPEQGGWRELGMVLCGNGP